MSRPKADTRPPLAVSIVEMPNGLRLCPFCGGEAYTRPAVDGACTDIITAVPFAYFVSCKGCGAEGPMGRAEQTAITMWNVRKG